MQQASSQPPRVAHIQLEHIIDGEVKPVLDKAGHVISYRAVGGHYVRSPNVRIKQVIGAADAQGVIKASIEVRNSATGGWVEKKAPSTLYPEHWSKRQVEQEIEAAFYNSKPRDSDIWEGLSPSGVKIRGYYRKPDDAAATAWPVYGSD